MADLSFSILLLFVSFFAGQLALGHSFPFIPLKLSTAVGVNFQPKLWPSNCFLHLMAKYRKVQTEDDEFPREFFFCQSQSQSRGSMAFLKDESLENSRLQFPTSFKKFLSNRFSHSIFNSYSDLLSIHPSISIPHAQLTILRTFYT